MSEGINEMISYYKPRTNSIIVLLNHLQNSNIDKERKKKKKNHQEKIITNDFSERWPTFDFAIDIFWNKPVALKI